MLYPCTLVAGFIFKFYLTFFLFVPDLNLYARSDLI